MKRRRSFSAVLVVALTATASVVVIRRARHHAPTGDTSEAEPEASSRVLVPLDPAQTLYDGKFKDGWEDWGWGPHEAPKAPGPLKIVFGGYGGIVLHHAETKSRFGAFSFRYLAPESWPNFLALSLKRAGSEEAVFREVVIAPKHVAELPGGWKEVLVPWSELNPRGVPIDRIAIVGHKSVGPDWVQLDKIILTKGAAASEATRDVSLSVQCGGATHPISPLIYGAANGDWDSGITAQRLGGNVMTRFNWDLGDTWNTGNDWFFENVKGKDSLARWVQNGTDHHAPTALVVPLIGWVAKDASSVGFPKSKFPNQRKFSSDRPEAGDGFKADGSKIAPGPPSETSVPAPPELIGKWIRDLHAKGGSAVNMYLLDNEPALWSSNHRDVHPDPVTYDELLDRTIKYASEIRKADPSAMIAGPTEWGWTNYFYSAKDSDVGVNKAPDRAAHDGTPLIPWYLKKLAEYEKANGTRLLDVLDVHFYPAADGVYGNNAHIDEDGSELRIRSTRALWDPEYRDESWINDKVSLIPRLKGWVRENYPGLKVSIGEWSFGADAHISGALATVEALGRFGQQGLDAAYYWDGPKVATKTFWAFRAFRNFDGKGSRFEDISLPTKEAENVSLFASRNAAGDHLVAILVNQDPRATARARIALTACGSEIKARSFSFSETSEKIGEGEEQPVSGEIVSTTLPPFSFTVLDVKLTPAPK